MLQIVERSAVRDRSNNRAELQRRHGNSLPEAAHAPHATFGLRNRLARVNAQLFAFDVVTCQFTQAELVGIVANALKTKLPAEFLKVEVVALGQRIGHVHSEAGEL